MEQFLDKISLRKIKILDYFNLEKRVLEARELTEYTGCTDKTLAKTMDLLQQDLINWSTKIQLIKKGKQEFYLEKSIDFSLDTIKLHYLKDSYLFKACEEIFRHTFVDITTFSSKIYVSYTAIYSRLNDLKPFLNKFGITFKPNSVQQFCGSEKQLRYFYMLFYWTSYWGMEWPFLEVKKEELTGIIELIEGIRKRSLGESEKEVLYYWLAIIFTRIKMGDYIEETESYCSIIDDTWQFNYMKSHVNQLFKQQWDLPDSVIENEVTFLFIVLYSFEYHDESSPLVSDLLVQGQTNAGEVYQAATYWIQILIKVFHIQLTSAEYGVLYANLVHLHTRVTVFKGGNYLFINENMFQSDSYLENAYSEVMEDFYRQLTAEKKFMSIFSNKLELLPNYLSLLYKFIDLTSQFAPVKAHIISIYGGNTVNRYAELLQRSCSEKIEFVSILTSDVDLVISDRTYMQIKDSDALVLIWDSIPKERDIQEARQQIRKLTLAKLELYRQSKMKKTRLIQE